MKSINYIYEVRITSKKDTPIIVKHPISKLPKKAISDPTISMCINNNKWSFIGNIFVNNLDESLEAALDVMKEKLGQLIDRNIQGLEETYHKLQSFKYFDTKNARK